MSASQTTLFPERPVSVLRVALPVPLRRSFDYLPPEPGSGAAPGSWQPGARVLVPFGQKRLVGILLEQVCDSAVPSGKLKRAVEVLDAEPLLPASLLALGQWAAEYYQHPLGEVLAAMLPIVLREGGGLWPESSWVWECLPAAADLAAGLKPGSRQRALLAWASNRIEFDRQALLEAGFNVPLATALLRKGVLARRPPSCSSWVPGKHRQVPCLALSAEQEAAVAAVSFGRFGCSLLEGVTGSGKTEVYLQLIDKVLARGEQAMVLVPEIGLTPQTVGRFRSRFACPVVVLHSGLAEGERLAAWRAVARGDAGVLIGTRSAIFTPMARPGILIVDEEHDSSFKQQDGFRYSARDLAVVRAREEGVPVLLGTATPSLETLHNAMQDRYQHLRLTQRAGAAVPPRLEILDIRGKSLVEGFSPELLQAMRDTLQVGSQVLVFLNRRGYAPALICADCSWQANCEHCSAKLTVHRKAGMLRCHHCEAAQTLPRACPVCQGTRLDYVGVGTQRSEHFLEQQFAEYPVWRVDRDSIARKQALDDVLAQVQAGRAGILVGTQMLAKGHHFPDVTLVVMLDIDQGLFSADFRGAEKMGQLLEQVAGRAGREGKPGRVLIQSRYASHPLLTTLQQEGYQRLARLLLAERQSCGLPPYTYLAILRAEHSDPVRCQRLLGSWREQLSKLSGAATAIQVAGPLPALMEKRAGLYRYDLQLKSTSRKALQGLLALFCEQVEKTGTPAGIRWSIDVDPAG